MIFSGCRIGPGPLALNLIICELWVRPCSNPIYSLLFRFLFLFICHLNCYIFESHSVTRMVDFQALTVVLNVGRGEMNAEDNANHLLVI